MQKRPVLSALCAALACSALALLSGCERQAAEVKQPPKESVKVEAAQPPKENAKTEVNPHPIANVRLDKEGWVLHCTVNGEPTSISFAKEREALPEFAADFALADVTGDGVDDLLVRVFIVGNTASEMRSDGHVYEVKDGELKEALSIPADGFGRWKPEFPNNDGICPAPGGMLGIDAAANKEDGVVEGKSFLLVRQNGEWTVKDAPEGFACSGAKFSSGDAPAALVKAMDDADFVLLISRGGTVAEIRQALADGANPNAEIGVQGSDETDTALCSAAMLDNTEVLRLLLAAGAKVNTVARAGRTALMYARSAAAVRILVEAGANLDVQDEDGQTALMSATAEGARVLLAAGANPKLKDKEGHDALWHARQSGHKDNAALIGLLEDALRSGTKKPAASKPEEAGKTGKGAAAAAPDKTYKNSIGMEFVLIAAGTFRMGCEPPEAGKCEPQETPRHEVTISQPYYLGKYEVTQAQWQAVMGNNPSKFKGANRPVESMTWLDAREFIKKLNAKEGHKRYRLPTEAEWEYAARAGSTTAYSFGDDVGQLGNYAWYKGNSGEETHPVGQKQPNAWGLFDMHGNVDEWVHDWYEQYDGAGAVTDPQRTGEEDDPDVPRVIRGGSWFYDAGHSRSTYRIWEHPEEGGNTIGFRLALTPQQ